MGSLCLLTEGAKQGPFKVKPVRRRRAGAVGVVKGHTNTPDSTGD